MGGSDLLSRAMPPSEDAYNAAISHLGLSSLSTTEQIKALHTIPAMDLLSKIPPSVHFGPVHDNDLIKHLSTFTSISTTSPPLPATSWLKSIVIGDSAHDGSILSLFLNGRKSNISQTFQSSLTSSLGAASANKLFSAYGLTPTSSDEDAYAKILSFGNDIAFYAPSMAYARHFLSAPDSATDGRVYTFRFNATNPWDGPLKGQSNHILDVAFLFQNYNKFLSEGQNAVAEAFADRVLAFVGGKEPWKRWDVPENKEVAPKDKATLVVSDGGCEEKIDCAPPNGRRFEFWQLEQEIGTQRLEDAWGAFMMGK